MDRILGFVPCVGLARTAITSTTSVGAADRGKTFDATSGTFAVNFAAAATLGSGFHVVVYNSGSGTVTLTANGAETIRSPAGAATTLALTQGLGVILCSTGSGLIVVANATSSGSSVTSSAIASALELVTASITNPTELNAIGTAVPDWRLVRTNIATSDQATLYRLDTNSASVSAPYIMASATAGLRWVAIAGRYTNQAINSVLGVTAANYQTSGTGFGFNATPSVTAPLSLAGSDTGAVLPFVSNNVSGTTALAGFSSVASGGNATDIGTTSPLYTGTGAIVGDTGFVRSSAGGGLTLAGLHASGGAVRIATGSGIDLRAYWAADGGLNFVGIPTASAPSVSLANEGAIYYDSTAQAFMQSSNGAAYAALGGGGGATTHQISPVTWFVDNATTPPNTGAGDYTVGVYFIPQREVTITGIRFYWASAGNETVNLKIWNSVDAAATATQSVVTAGVGYYTATFGSPYAVPANRVSVTHYATMRDNAGAIYTKTATANSASVLESPVCFCEPGVWFGTSSCYAAGDAQPTPGPTAERYPVEPVFDMTL